MITLKNTQIEVGIVPDLGGRVVMLRKPGMANIFKSDSTEWNDPVVRPGISLHGNFKAFNGHIVWLGPQSEWWVKQDLNQDRRDKKSIWPPDPYLTYGDYRVIGQTDTSISMIGPESPISGIQLEKTITLHASGMVTFDALARNIRNEPVAWGIWMNTRLDGSARCYVPSSEDSLLRLAEKEERDHKPIPYRFHDGYFTFVSISPGDSLVKFVQKAFMIPTENFMAGFSDHQMLKIGFEPVPQERIHPDQAAVEIYNMRSTSASLLELEIHGPYDTLQPGGKMHLSETWQLFKYDGEDEPEAHIDFINQTVKGHH